MKNTTKRALSVLLALLMAFSAFGVSAFAVEGGTDFDDAVPVGGSFTATLRSPARSFFEYEIMDSGLYRISMKLDDAIANSANIKYSLSCFMFADTNMAYLSKSNSDDAEPGCVSWTFAALDGETCYFDFSFRAYSINENNIIINEDITANADITIEYFGTIKEIKPYNQTEPIRIFDYDCWDFSEDAPYFGFPSDFESIPLEITFTNGAKKIIEAGSYEYDGGDPYLESNEFGVQSYTAHVFDFPVKIDIEYVEYCTSLEVIKAPDKSDYVYGIDGFWADNGYFEPWLDLTGTVIEVTLYDGSVKTYELDESFNDGYGNYTFDDGTEFSIPTAFVTMGKTEAEIDVYMSVDGGACSRTTKLTIDVVNPSIIQFFQNIGDYISNFFKSLFATYFPTRGDVDEPITYEDEIGRPTDFAPTTESLSDFAPTTESF